MIPRLALLATLAGLPLAITGAGGTSAAQEGPVPVLGRSVTVTLVSGTVLIKPKGSRKFHKLAGGEVIPVGSSVDTRRGRVSLASAVNKQGGFKASDFFAGRFRVAQRRRDNAVTDLILNGKLENCGKGASAAAKKRKGRRLWGSGKGKFRTRGKRSAALVRGTEWLVYDQCDSSTYNAVRKGTVAVRDFRLKKTIRLKAGQKYIAR